MVAGSWWLVKTGTVSDVCNVYAMEMLATMVIAGCLEDCDD